MYTWSIILKLSWAVVRSRIRIHYSKAVGVAVSGMQRQARLRQLAGYQSEEISLGLIRKPDNKYDLNAIRLVATIKGGNGFIVGYVKSSLAVAKQQISTMSNDISLESLEISGS